MYVCYIYIYIYIYIYTVKKGNNFEVTGKTLEFLNFYNVKNLNILQLACYFLCWVLLC